MHLGSGSQHVVLGPPGCGKTTELLRLLETHLEHGLPTRRVAYFSFTRKAIEVAKTRAMSKFTADADDLPYFRTVHSMAFAENGHSKKDVIGTTHYTEIAQALGIEFKGAAIDETTGLPSGGGEGDQHIFLDALARARRVSLEQQWREADIPDLDFRAVERTVAAVTRYKQENGLVDFTDMLEIYDERGQALDVDVAFVDEAQDLSTLQWSVLQLMLSQCASVYIAGDDDQAIYRWSGADVTSFLELEGERRTLRQSWRCPQRVHAVACAISDRIQQRIPKAWSSREQIGSVERVHSLDSFDFTQLQGTTLLLARNTHLLPEFANQLRKRGVAYTTSHGTPSVRRAHVKAIYAWTKLLKGQAIMGADVMAIYDQLIVGKGVQRGFKSLSGMERDDSFTEAVLRAQWGLLAQGPWYEALEGIPGSDRMYYRAIMRQGTSLLDPPQVQVNTIHGVKGGEADNVVIVPDMAQRSYRGLERAPDDEHRVAYVAVSRARQNLFLVSPRTRNFYPYDVS